MTALVQIDWWAMDSRNADPAFPLGYPYYVSCDFCQETACEDIWAGKSEPDYRQFMRLFADGAPQEVVCEHCIEEFLKEN